MAGSSFGTIFRITTWGESHGKAIGVVIDGCPSGLPLSEEEINAELALRAPGNSPFTSPRKEEDQAHILSGVFEGVTTGTPISIILYNKDADSSKYTPIKDLLRPGHATFTYLEKYGIFDYRGGGRASGRETACRVAAGAVAKKLLKHFDIDVVAYIKEIGESSIGPLPSSLNIHDLRTSIRKSPLFCPDQDKTSSMIALLEAIKNAGDSLGGVVEVLTSPLPIGLGDPVYEKLEANLAKALLSIPASKGMEIGAGFASTKMQGSTHNDLFIKKERMETHTNHSGGTLAGISNGMPLSLRVAFKPTSSIQKTQLSLNALTHQPEPFTLPPGSKHDPCVAIRAVPVVEAMVALVLADALLLNRSSRL